MERNSVKSNRRDEFRKTNDNAKDSGPSPNRNTELMRICTKVIEKITDVKIGG